MRIGVNVWIKNGIMQTRDGNGGGNNTQPRHREAYWYLTYVRKGARGRWLCIVSINDCTTSTELRPGEQGAQNAPERRPPTPAAGPRDRGACRETSVIKLARPEERGRRPERVQNRESNMANFTNDILRLLRGLHIVRADLGVSQGISTKDVDGGK